jgi:hypothetical protein
VNAAHKLIAFGRVAFWSALLIAFDVLFILTMLGSSLEFNQGKLSRLVHDNPTLQSERTMHAAFADARRKGIYLAVGTLVVAALITTGGVALIVRDYRRNKVHIDAHPTQVT